MVTFDGSRQLQFGGATKSVNRAPQGLETFDRRWRDAGAATGSGKACARV
jgi:hypothetical protein